MTTKIQHFVPRAYLKAWEGPVTSQQNPSTVFNGVYFFTGDDKIGDGRNKGSILWKPNLYTVSFEQAFIGEKCPKIKKDFVEKIYKLMRNRKPQPVYGKHGRAIIKTKESIRKHMADVDEWEFYYDDGNLARKGGIIKSIHDLNSYILEDEFSRRFETSWPNVLSQLIHQLHDPSRRRKEGKDQYVDFETNTAYEIFAFFQMMQCRSPRFDGLGVLTWLNNIIKDSLEGETETMMEALWYTELYKMLFQNNHGYYHTMLKSEMEHCQMICFEVMDGAGMFITSDNPAFLYKTKAPERYERTGYYFPISPYHLLFMGKGSGLYNSMIYRVADRKTVRLFNQMIYQAKDESIVSKEKELEAFL